MRPPWVACDRESKELLAICLKKINGLNKVHLVDANFLWTEPHSRRLKVKLVIQKDVMNGAKLQQTFAVEVQLQNQQCDACQRSYTDHKWRAQVQVRQKVDHKKTFYLLEQLILKHNAHQKCIDVEQVREGVNFAFSERSHALKFIDFLNNVVPTRTKAAKQLISEDIQNADKNYKFTFSVEMVPLCKDDLVVLPKNTAGSMGNIDPLVLVYRVAAGVYAVDPRTLQMAELSSEKYWREPFRPLLPSSQLEEFIVLDIRVTTFTPLGQAAMRRKMSTKGGKKAARAAAQARESATDGHSTSGKLSGVKRDRDDSRGSVTGASSVMGGSKAGGFTGAVSLAGGSVHFNGAMSVASTVTGGPRGKLLLADATVMRVRDLGTCDQQYHVRTHLGNILRSGDYVLGYDLTRANYNDGDADGSGEKGRGRSGRVDLPDIVLVRKVYKKDVKERASTAAASAPGAAAATEAGMEDAAPVAASKKRVWKLKRLEDVMPVRQGEALRKGDEEKAAADYEDFLRSLEEDSALRKTINLYKDAAALEARQAAKAAVAAAKASGVAAVPAAAAARAGDDEDDDEEDNEDEGGIGLEELLDELTLGTGGAGEAIDEEDDEDDEDGSDAEEEEEAEAVQAARSKRAATATTAATGGAGGAAAAKAKPAVARGGAGGGPTSAAAAAQLAALLAEAGKEGEGEGESFDV